MNLEPFFTIHALVEELRRQCVIDYWEQRQSDDPLGQFGPRQLNQLIVIMNHQPCALQDVMHHTGLSAPAASAAVDKLVRAGIVHRELNPENRRSIRLTVDPEIRKSLDEIDRNFRSRVEQLFQAATPAELAAIETVGTFLSTLRRPKGHKSC